MAAPANGAKPVSNSKPAEFLHVGSGGHTGGKVLRGDGRTLPGSTPKSGEISRELKRRGFKFVGPVIVYAWMQAVGIVDDHALACFRRRAGTA